MAIPTTNISMKDVYNNVSNSATTTTPYSLKGLFDFKEDSNIIVNPFAKGRPILGDGKYPYILFGVHSDNDDRFFATFLPKRYKGLFTFNDDGTLSENNFNTVKNILALPIPNTNFDVNQLPIMATLCIPFYPDDAIAYSDSAVISFKDDCMVYSNGMIYPFLQCTVTTSFGFITSYKSFTDNLYIYFDRYHKYLKKLSKIINGFDVLNIFDHRNIGISFTLGNVQPSTFKNTFTQMYEGDFIFKEGDSSGNTVEQLAYDGGYNLGAYAGYDKNAHTFGREIQVVKNSGSRFGYTVSIPQYSPSSSEIDYTDFLTNIEYFDYSRNTYLPFLCFYNKVNETPTNVMVFSGQTIQPTQSAISTPLSFTVNLNDSTAFNRVYTNLGYQIQGSILSNYDNNSYLVGMKTILPNFDYKCAQYTNNGFVKETYTVPYFFQPYPYIDAKSTSGNSSYISVEASSAPYANINNHNRTFNVTFKHQLPATLNIPSWLTASRNSLPDYTTGETSGETTVTFTATTNTANRTGLITLTNSQYALNGHIDISQVYAPRNITVRVDYIYKVSNTNYNVVFAITNNSSYQESFNYKIGFTQAGNGTSTKNVTGSVSIQPNSSQTTGVNLTCDAGYTSISNAAFDTSYFDADTVTYTSGTYLNSSGQIILP